MEIDGDQEHFGEDRQAKLQYGPPELTSLGQIQSLIQSGCMCGGDGGPMFCNTSS